MRICVLFDHVISKIWCYDCSSPDLSVTSDCMYSWLLFVSEHLYRIFRTSIALPTWLPYLILSWLRCRPTIKCLVDRGISAVSLPDLFVDMFSHLTQNYFTNGASDQGIFWVWSEDNGSFAQRGRHDQLKGIPLIGNRCSRLLILSRFTAGFLWCASLWHIFWSNAVWS